MVCVGPPLLARGPTFGSNGDAMVPLTSEASSPLAPLDFPTRLCPREVKAPDRSGADPAVFKAMRVLASLTLPAARAMPPPAAIPAWPAGADSVAADPAPAVAV